MGAMDNRRSATQYCVCWVVDFYHHERNHQGLGNVLIFPSGVQARRDDPLVCRERLGGVLKFYHRPAA
jgi:putative transposase